MTKRDNFWHGVDTPNRPFYDMYGVLHNTEIEGYDRDDKKDNFLHGEFVSGKTGSWSAYVRPQYMFENEEPTYETQEILWTSDTPVACSIHTGMFGYQQRTIEI